MMCENVELEIFEKDQTEILVDLSLNDIYSETDSIVYIDSLIETPNADLYFIYNNHTTKDLLKICNFYNLTKTHKLKNQKKDYLINIILIFENDIENVDLVNKRLTYWCFMNELKQDKEMRKYIIW
jgi:hypothetical protein